MTDFSKGFDLVDHFVLVSELRDLWVHEALIRWIGASLTGSPTAVCSPRHQPREGLEN